MSEIRIRVRQGRSDYADVPMEQLALDGRRRYVIEGPETDLAAMQISFPEICELLSPTVLQLEFGNSVGFVDLPGLGRRQVLSGKWDERHFEKLLQDITDVLSELPFSASGAGALPYERSALRSTSVLYHEFVYLRHILSDSAPRPERLLPVLREILADPHRRFADVRETVAPAFAHRVDSKTLADLLSGASKMARVRTDVSLARALRGHLPEKVSQRRVCVTHDTAENRFVKSFLAGAGSVIQRLRDVAEACPQQSRLRRVLPDCADMERKLRPIQANSFWHTIGPLVQVPVGSTVLQRRSGYRDVLRHFVRLRLASRVPLPGRVIEDILQIKDIATLYELWCYFALIRQLEGLFGKPARVAGKSSDLEVGLSRDLEVSWPNGAQLLYNPAFPRSATRERSSYSVGLRPDIALVVPSGANRGLHLMDAKFRLESASSVLPESVSEAEAEETSADERVGRFKRGDLYKMHTYRDAIPLARSVWALYPGTEMRFFSEGPVQVYDAAHNLPSVLRGVGAIPLQPDASPRELAEVLSHLFSATPG